MKTFLALTSLFLIAFIILFFILGLISRAGKASGMTGNRLAGCPDKTNCVSSEDKNDPDHYIDPIVIPENITVDVLPMLKESIVNLGGNIQKESDRYLASTFSSTIFGFVDDLELRIDSEQKLIHLRSASRVGNYDMGVNRRRTELLKNIINRKFSQASYSLNKS